MTVYERICKDKKFAASMLSEALNGCDYEDEDYDPAIMKILDSEVKEATEK